MTRVLDIAIDGRHIEAVWHGPDPETAPTLVLLHEGLGSVSLWRDFPQRLAEATGLGVLVTSRFGYGGSASAPLPRPLSYMHDEALDILPKILDQAGVKRAILIGHSDGGSIATIYAGSVQDFRIRGLVLIAPHFVVEDVSIRSIAKAREAFEHGDLRERLMRHHGDNVDVAFRGWNDAWLDPDFRAWRIDESIAYIRVPILILQGEDDEYGTAEQIEIAKAEAYCPVEAMLIPKAGHAPHLDAPDIVRDAIADFSTRLFSVHEPRHRAA